MDDPNHKEKASASGTVVWERLGKDERMISSQAYAERYLSELCKSETEEGKLKLSNGEYADEGDPRVLMERAKAQHWANLYRQRKGLPKVLGDPCKRHSNTGRADGMRDEWGNLEY